MKYKTVWCKNYEYTKNYEKVHHMVVRPFTFWSSLYIILEAYVP